MKGELCFKNEFRTFEINRYRPLANTLIQKLLRVKQIEDNQGATLVSEGIDANYQDMVNYAVFALIHLSENSNMEIPNTKIVKIK